MKKLCTPRVIRHIPRDAADRHGRLPLGLCRDDTKTIYLNPKQSQKEHLITAAHETLHYLYPKKREAYVERDGEIIGNVLWKVGYRCRKPKV